MPESSCFGAGNIPNYLHRRERSAGYKPIETGRIAVAARLRDIVRCSHQPHPATKAPEVQAVHVGPCSGALAPPPPFRISH